MDRLDTTEDQDHQTLYDQFSALAGVNAPPEPSADNVGSSCEELLTPDVTVKDENEPDVDLGPSCEDYFVPDCLIKEENEANAEPSFEMMLRPDVIVKEENEDSTFDYTQALDVVKDQEVVGEISPGEEPVKPKAPMTIASVKQILKGWDDLRQLAVKYHPNKNEVERLSALLDERLFEPVRYIVRRVEASGIVEKVKDKRVFEELKRKGLLDKGATKREFTLDVFFRRERDPEVVALFDEFDGRVMDFFREELKRREKKEKKQLTIRDFFRPSTSM